MLLFRGIRHGWLSPTPNPLPYWEGTLRPLVLGLFFFTTVPAVAQEQEKDKPAPALPPPPKELRRPVNDSLYLKKGQVFFGGAASLANSASRARSGSAYPPQSSLLVELEPSLGLMLNGASSLGLAASIRLQNQDNSLPSSIIYPQGSRIRQKENRYIFTPNVGLYQAALNRLYVRERFGIGPSVGSIQATLTDSTGSTIEERSFQLRGVEAAASVGFLYFIRREVALDVLLTYRFAWEKIESFNPPQGTLDAWLPTGRYSTQGIRLQVGVSIFIK